jgi:hypothetical protein
MHESDRLGRPPKPPPKAPEGIKRLGVADFFKPSNWTASDKKAAEGKVAKAHAEHFAGDSSNEEISLG